MNNEMQWRLALGMNGEIAINSIARIRNVVQGQDETIQI